MGFRVFVNRKINRTQRISESVLNDLEEVCRAQHVSLNALIEQCCIYALENMDDEMYEELPEYPPRRKDQDIDIFDDEDDD
jgi:hypothetical protein